MTVGSMEDSVRFYRDTLGMTVDPARTGEWSTPFLAALTGYPGCSLRITMVVADDGTRIQLEQFVVPEEAAQQQSWASPGGGHVCLEVSDIFAVAEAVRAGGYEILSRPPEPVPLPAESVNAGGYMLGVRDPDGHVIEVLQTPRSPERWIPRPDGAGA
jgi:catechol 2,3-dioxygenase-like lactoylglutathione lyase family enzyme